MALYIIYPKSRIYLCQSFIHIMIIEFAQKIFSEISIGDVKMGITNTRKNIPKDQIIL